jgi:predicted ATPase
MKIIISDFGPVKSFEFNMAKSFIGIFGKNNSGKSYSISTVYIIIKNILEIYSDLSFYLRILIDNDIEEFKEKLKKSYRSRKGDVDIKEQFELLFKSIVSGIFIERLSNSFYSTFNDLKNLKRQSSKNYPKIILDTDILKLSFVIKKENILDDVKIKDKIILRQIKTNRNVKYEKHKTILYLSSTNDDTFNKNCYEYSNMVLFSFIEEVTNYVDYVYYLPASRSGLYQALSAFSQIFAELAQKRGFFINKFEIPNIPEPLSDYFLRLSEINVRSKHYLAQSELYNIVEEIEKEILKGEVFFDDDNKKMFYIPENLNIRLDVSMTSSMVSEISPIVSYLKYILPIKPTKRSFPSKKGKNAVLKKPNKTLIFIEEPEAHLHPGVQIQLMEIFSKLTKMNVKIVITSHSNYMFNRMNNLILAKKLLPENIQVLVFDESENGSIANTTEIDELGVEDNNFLDIY